MVLIDTALAVAAGMSTVYQIKALLQDIPIIALSPSGDIDPVMAYEMGAIAVARKSAFRKLLFRYAGVGPWKEYNRLPYRRHSGLPGFAIWRTIISQTRPDCGDPPVSARPSSVRTGFR